VTKIVLHKDFGSGKGAEYTATGGGHVWRVISDDDARYWLAFGHDEYGLVPIDAMADTLAGVREQLSLAVDNPRGHEKMIEDLGLAGANNPPMRARQGGWNWDHTSRKWRKR
jgi:hypothetical protein